MKNSIKHGLEAQALNTPPKRGNSMPKLKYGIGQEVVVPVSSDTRARLSRQTVQEGLQALLDHRAEDPGGSAPAIREAAADPRSVIEMKTPEGYLPLERETPLNTILHGRKNLEILVSRPHAGG